MELNKNSSPTLITNVGGFDQAVIMPLDGGYGLLGPSPISSCVSKEAGDNNPAVPTSRINVNDSKAEVVLNPDAEEWDFRTNRAPEEDRCLFLTFSNGYPLTHAQIIRFFTR